MDSSSEDDEVSYLFAGGRSGALFQQSHDLCDRKEQPPQLDDHDMGLDMEVRCKSQLLGLVGVLSCTVTARRTAISTSPKWKHRQVSVTSLPPLRGAVGSDPLDLQKHLHPKLHPSLHLAASASKA